MDRLEPASNASSKLENNRGSLIAVALELASVFYAIRLVRKVTRALGEGRPLSP